METFPRPAFLACSLALTAVASGCMSGPGADLSPDFAEGIQQNDIPVPLHFQFDKEKSFAYNKYTAGGVGSFRSWTGYYYGDQQVGNLVPWYSQQMEVDGWIHKETRNELDKKRLTFVKGDEKATIWLYRHFDHRYDRYATVVMAKIQPTPIEEMAPEEVFASGDRAASPPRASAGVQPSEARRLRLAALEASLAAPGAGSAAALSGPASSGSPKAPNASPRKPSASRDPGAAGPAPVEDNKPVVREELGAENNEVIPAAEEFSPEDGE